MGERVGGREHGPKKPNPNKIYDGGTIEEVIVRGKINQFKYEIKIDMTKAPRSTSINAKGFPRNAGWFWQEVYNKKPEMFSKGNIWRIENNISPRVDNTWIEHNPTHAGYKNDVLVHHHIDQGRFAVGIPDKIHRGYFKELHNRSANWFKINRIKSAGRTLNVFATFTAVLDIYKIGIGHPDAPLSSFDANTPLNTLRGISDYENYSFQNYYYEIKSKNKENTKFMLEFYNSFEKVNGVYRGVGKGIPYVGEIKNGKITILQSSSL